MKRIGMLSVVMCAGVLFAQEDEVAAVVAAATEAADAAEATNALQQVTFTTLPLARRVEGKVQVCLPGGEWTTAEEGRFYPFGAHFRTGPQSKFVLQFGLGTKASIGENSEIGTRVQELGVKSRTVVPVNGRIDLTLPDNLPEGALFVAAPGFTVKNPAGTSIVEYEPRADGDFAVIRCVTGTLGVEGRHFDAPTLKTANALSVRTIRDHLVSIITGVTGSYPVEVDQGFRMKEDLTEDGQITNVAQKAGLTIRMAPKTKIVINRLLPALGERMSVHTMVFDDLGVLKSECAFSEGRAEDNSGELVRNEKIDKAAVAKRIDELAKMAEELAAKRSEQESASEPSAEAAEEE